MRAVALFAAVQSIQVDVDASNQYLEDQLSNVDLECFQKECHEFAAECSKSSASCAKRMACLSDKSKPHEAEHCFGGLTLATMSVPEQKVMQCAQSQECLTLSPAAASLMQAYATTNAKLSSGSNMFLNTALAFGGEPPALDSEYKQDLDELDSAEAKLKSFTAHTREKIGDIEKKTRELNRKQADLPDADDDSSLIQMQVAADGSAIHEDPVDHLLSGIENMISKMQVKNGMPSFAELAEKTGPVAKLDHLDDTTMIVALGALTAAMGANDEAVSFLQSGDNAVSKAYELGMAMGSTPEFLQSMFTSADPKLSKIKLEEEAGDHKDLREHPA